MTNQKRLVLDANILLRAALGIRVLNILETYDGLVSFHTPDICFRDARKYVGVISAKQNLDATAGFLVLDRIALIVQTVDQGLYEEHEAAAKARMRHRDLEDWPIVATSLLLKCPIWTEDQDFFGSGIATWTTNTVELYMQDSPLII